MCFTNCLSSSSWDEQPIKEVQILVDLLMILGDQLHIKSGIHSITNCKSSSSSWGPIDPTNSDACIASHTLMKRSKTLHPTLSTDSQGPIRCREIPLWPGYEFIFCITCNSATVILRFSVLRKDLCICILQTEGGSCHVQLCIRQVLVITIDKVIKNSRSHLIHGKTLSLFYPGLIWKICGVTKYYTEWRSRHIL